MYKHEKVNERLCKKDGINRMRVEEEEKLRC